MTRRGYGLIGVLITMAIIVVLFALYATSVNKAVTGEGSAQPGTVRSMEDQIQLQSIHQAFYIQSMSETASTARGRGRGRFIVPSEVSRTNDPSLDTTANLYSCMIALNYLRPETLISPNEFSGWVEPDTDYDFYAYQPTDGQFWDPDFKADLRDISNVSYAHMPLYGERFEKHWSNESRNLVIGNRGPRDGIDDPNSLTYGRNGRWGGHIVFGDGHIDFVTTFTPGTVQVIPGEDNVFRLDEGPRGIDAMLGFTGSMTRDGPEFLWD